MESTTGSFFNGRQCDQMWRNFANLAKFRNLCAAVQRFIWYLVKLWTHLGTFCMLLGKILSLQMAKYWKDNLAIWSHWRPLLLGQVFLSNPGFENPEINLTFIVEISKIFSYFNVQILASLNVDSISSHMFHTTLDGFLKLGHSRPLFLYFSSFQYTVDSIQ